MIYQCPYCKEELHTLYSTTETQSITRVLFDIKTHNTLDEDYDVVECKESIQCPLCLQKFNTVNINEAIKQLIN